jgi:hypothetical protein
MNTLIKTLITILIIITACSNEHQTEIIQLTYKLENDKISYRRLGAFLWEEPKIEISCQLTNTSPYNGEFNIIIDATSEKAEKKEITIKRYIKALETINIKHSEKIKRNTFKKLYIKNFKIYPQYIEINKKTREQIFK